MLRKFLKLSIERFPMITMVYRNLRDQLDRRQPAIVTPWGFTLAGHEDMAKGSFEPMETKLIRELLQDVDILVNVGANVGYYCCHALSLDKPVIAVEPVPRNIAYLLRNIAENGWEKMAEVFPVALGEGVGIQRLWGGGTGASLIKGWAGTPESYVMLVPVMTLDSILGDKLQGRKSLILVDVEGAEFMMLKGSSKALSNTPKPIWIIEISSTEHQPNGVVTNPNYKKTFKLFFDHGYRAFTADKFSREVTEDDVMAADVGALELHTNNYIFR